MSTEQIPIEDRAHTDPETKIDDSQIAVGRGASLWSDAWRELRRNPVFILAGLFLILYAAMALFPGLFTSKSPTACSLSNSLLRPSSEAWFGTDLQGCDYYTRVIYGTRVSFIVGLVTVALSVLIAVVLGAIAGYYGGIVDSILARITDIWFGIPFILGALVILNSAFSVRSVWSLVVVLAVFGWPSMMRLMRSEVLSEKEEDYVTAARALGAGDLRIITKHILPNSMAPVIVYATITIGLVIAAEATLSFLGVGLQLPAISWGLMISGAQRQIQRAPHLLFFPGVFLSGLVLAFIMLGDALRDALDPKLR
jgi:oligopeptide transport system permease protein